MKYWLIYPFAFAIYPVVSLLALNIGQTAPSAAIRGLLLSISFSGALLILFRWLLGAWSRAGLAATLTLVLFFSYGHVYGLTEYLQFLGINIGRHRVLVPIWLLVYGIDLWLIARKVRQPKKWTPALNLVSTVLCLMPVVQIVYYGIGSSIAHASLSRKPVVVNDRNHNTERPDIYYVILDTYTRADALEQSFNYDNSQFLAELEGRGFYVAPCSQSNYPTTTLSLASSLNMQYIPSLVDGNSDQLPDLPMLYPTLRNNAVVETLQEQGYTFIAAESGYSPTDFTNADTYLAPQKGFQLWKSMSGGLTSFEATLLRTSLGGLLYEFRFYLPGDADTILDAAYITHRDRMLFELDRLDNMASTPGPKFVFVHILAPHNPFVFGPEGEATNRKTPFTLDDDLDALRFEDYSHGFTSQVTYLNKRTLQFIDNILVNSKTPPIIIIQGDHGSPRSGIWRMAILNAYYLPDGQAKLLYPAITPVNTFRIILNAFFGAQLPLLDDVACFNKENDFTSCTVWPEPSVLCKP